jgi:outer membrane protein assembly factor BamB
MSHLLTSIAVTVALAAGGTVAEPVAATLNAFGGQSAIGPAQARGVAASDTATKFSQLGPPLYHRGVLYVGTADGVAGLDPQTGKVIVNYRTGSPVLTSPAVIRAFDPQPDPPGTLVAAASDGTLSAFAIGDGRLLWQENLGAGPTSALVVHGMIIHGSAQPGDVLVIGAGNRLSAFDATGSKLWTTRLEGGDVSKGGAVMIDQTNELIAVSAGHTLYALDVASGAIRWSR